MSADRDTCRVVTAHPFPPLMPEPRRCGRALRDGICPKHHHLTACTKRPTDPEDNGRTKPIEPIVGCSDCNGYGYHGHTNPNLGDRCSSCEGTGLDNGRSSE